MWNLTYGKFPSFFRFCMLHFSKNPQASRPEDDMIKAPRQAVMRTKVLPNGDKQEEEVDLLTEFSWRNFFATINFAKIMQKLSKHRSHRIRMLVQYKSSVSALYAKFFQATVIDYQVRRS